MGPFTAPMKTSLLAFNLSNSVPFIKSVAFIMVVVVVALTGAVVVAILLLLWRRRHRSYQARKYQCEFSFSLSLPQFDGVMAM